MAEIQKILFEKCGKGYLVEVEPQSLAQSATICCWFMDIPMSGTPWTKYIISAITLKDIEGVKPASKLYPEAEYEIMVVALDPRENPVQDNPETWMHLRPINYAKQFHGIDEYQVQGLVELVVKAVLDGYLWIELEGVRGMRELWDNAIDTTIDHFKNPEKCKHEHEVHNLN